MIKSLESKNSNSASMGDDFLEMRFDPKYKKIFQAKIESNEQSSIGRSYSIPVMFLGNFDSKTQKIIKNLVSRVFQNAEAFDLKLVHSDPEVHFYTLTQWKKESAAAIKKRISLPASKIIRKNSVPIIQLVIPERITTNEVLIKTVRLLFSKLFGKLFFDEKISLKPAYRLLTSKAEDINFDLEEKARFCRLYDRFSNSLEAEFVKLGKQFRIKGKKAIEFGKKEYFNLLLTEDSTINPKYVDLLNNCFLEHHSKARDNPNEFYLQITNRIFNFLPQSNVILPHEFKSFLSLKNRQQWALFHALDERLLFVKNTYYDLQECYEYLNTISSQSSIDYATSDYWINTLNNRMIQLKKKGLVKLFLIENSYLSPNQSKESSEFPLWIWRHRLFENYSKNSPPEKTIKKITDQYKNSIYQKLFEASYRSIQCLKQMQKNHALSFFQSSGHQRIKTLIAWFKINNQILIDIMHACKICIHIYKQDDNKLDHSDNILRNFEQGWSYFISFALIHQYYLNSQNHNRKNASKGNQFFSLIEKYIKNKFLNQPPFQISGLFLEIYKQKDFNLRELIRLIIEDTKALDFFVLNQKRLFDNKKETVEEIVRNHASSVLQWQSQHDRYKIRKDELNLLSRSTDSIYK